MHLPAGGTAAEIGAGVEVACKAVPQNMGEKNFLFIVSLFQRQQFPRCYRVHKGMGSLIIHRERLGGGSFSSPLTVINSLVNFTSGAWYSPEAHGVRVKLLCSKNSPEL